MSALSEKVFRKMENQRIREAAIATIRDTGMVNLSVLYAAARTRSPEFLRALIISAAREVDPVTTAELDEVINR